MRTDQKSRDTVAKRMAIGGLLLAVVVPIFLPPQSRLVCFGVGSTLIFLAFYIGSTPTRGGDE